MTSQQIWFEPPRPLFQQLFSLWKNTCLPDGSLHLHATTFLVRTHLGFKPRQPIWREPSRSVSSTIYCISTVNTQHMQRPDILVQLGYIWRHVSAVKRPSSGQQRIVFVCLLDRVSLSQLKNKRQTWCHLLFYFASYVLNKHVSDINISIIRSLRPFCWIITLVVLFLVRCVLDFVLQPATWIPLQPNHTETPTHVEPRTIRPMW